MILFDVHLHVLCRYVDYLFFPFMFFKLALFVLYNSYKLPLNSQLILCIYSMGSHLLAFWERLLHDPSEISQAVAITKHVRNPLGAAVLCWMLTGSHAVDFFARMRAIREGIEQSRSSDDVQKFAGCVLRIFCYLFKYRMIKKL